MIFSPTNFFFKKIESLFFLFSFLVGLLFFIHPASARRFRVQSIPRGAKIYINGTYRGLAPRVFSISSGQYHLELRKRGYLTWANYIQIPPSSDMFLKIHLNRQSRSSNIGSNGADFQTPPSSPYRVRKGLLVVTSSPTGVPVYVGGRYIGTTPILKRLPLGTHEIVLRQAGFRIIRRRAKITLMKSFRINVKMQTDESASTNLNSNTTASTQLVLFSKPNANVYLNTRFMGRTPVISAGLQPGEYRLKMTARGYQTYIRKFKLYPGQHLRLKIFLVPKSKKRRSR